MAEAEITNIFTRGVMDKDTNPIWLENGKITHAENLRFFNDSSNGVPVNIQGNVLLQDLVQDIENPFCIGGVKDIKNLKIYSFVAGDNIDRIIEYDKVTGQSVIVLSGDKSKLGFDKKRVIHGVNVINGLLYWTQWGKPPRKINIERAKTYGHNNFTEDDISVIKAPPEKEPRILLKRTDSLQENDIEDRFISFAYRYKYLDNEYSAISFYSDVAFSPKKFRLTYDDLDNEGMMNNFNSCEIFFDTGAPQVIGIDIIFRETNSNTAYLIQSFNKQKEGWGDNDIQSIDFYNNKLFAAISDNEVKLLYDNVPLQALSQDLIGNILVYANYMEGFDMIDSNGNEIIADFTLEILSESMEGDLINPDIAFEKATFDMSNTELVQGNTLNMELDFNPLPGNTFEVPEYNNVFPFILEESYDNFEDLYNSTSFKEFLSSVDSAFKNSIILDPDTQEIIDYVPIGFNYENPNKFVITTPSFTVKETITPEQGEPVINYYTVGYNMGLPGIYIQESIINRSLKSNRSYEVVCAYYDKYNRLVGVMDCETNTIFNPHQNANKKNTLRVTINHKPPKDAVKYKLGIKQTKNEYEVVYSWRYYIDGQYAWIKLEGSNKHKVTEGDTLIIKNNSGEFENSIIRVKVLDVVNQPSNFIDYNFVGEDTRNEIMEEAGLYMKIRRTGTGISYDGDEFFKREHSASRRTSGRMTINLGTFARVDEQGNYDNIPINAGARVTIYIHNWRGSGIGGSGANFIYDETRIATQTYDNLYDCWLGEFGGTFGEDFENQTRWVTGTDNPGSDMANVTNNPDDGLILQVDSRVGASLSNRQRLEVRVTIENTSGTLIFETLPKHEDDSLFYETIGTYNISEGYHQANEQNQTEDAPAVLHSDYYNCYAYSNGIESYKIKDVFNEKSMVMKFRALATLPEGYHRTHRNADLTYSDFYNVETNYNGLSRFNSALANWKSLSQEVGSIQRIKTRNTDLLVIQEFQTSVVLFGKSVLYNAEGVPNVQQFSDILGQEVFLTGFGTQHPASLGYYGNDYYWVDANKAAIIALTGNSVTEINRLGFNNKWIKICKENTDFMGCYDVENNEYLIKFSNDTDSQLLSFQREAQGFQTFYPYVPDFLFCCDKVLYAWKNGKMYQQHVSENYNEFFGETFPSKISFVVNQQPFTDKIFQSISLRSTHPWNVKLTSNLNHTYITDQEFNLMESFYNYHIPNSINEDFKSSYGIGAAEDSTDNEIIVKAVPYQLSINDLIYDEHNNLIGQVLSADKNKIILSEMVYPVSPGTYIFGKKNARTEGASIRGNVLTIDMEITTNEKVMLFGVTTRFSQSEAN